VRLGRAQATLQEVGSDQRDKRAAKKPLSVPAAEDGTKRNADRGSQGDAYRHLIERRTDCCADADTKSDPKP
jgi:hypothetical protein